jgi:hypothetical protein
LPRIEEDATAAPKNRLPLGRAVQNISYTYAWRKVTPACLP